MQPELCCVERERERVLAPDTKILFPLIFGNVVVVRLTVKKTKTQNSNVIKILWNCTLPPSIVCN